MRTAKISSSATIKFNTGNYESLEVFKSVETEVSYDKPEELAEKSKSLDKLTHLLLKEEVEHMFAQTKRKRVAKVNGAEIPIGIWEELE